ncbi:GDP-mannose 4,6-dehydratase [Apibacter sp. HY039]|uniref:GDP-mannose 4,6-dehydratase n=1 Tax=Apibacter sp. HY039 TaxID=2501476 RepID=UPI000FEBA25D|nr:GDP-mannose 4,6-dehydratase [Apibacter sp. HY039]
MQKILVTGADGFIGSHLTQSLLDEGYVVVALSYYNSFNYRGWLEHIVHPNLTIISGDIRDPNFCRNIMVGIDTVFHLAALIGIPYSYISPDNYVDVNIKGTLNICQAAKETGVNRLLVTSTSEVYGSAKYVPIDENHPKQPQSPYSASKIGADSLALSFYYSYDLPVTVVRPFNVYGPRQSTRAIIPTIITQIAYGKSTIQLGDLSTSRDFNYVKDTCKGFIQLAKCNEAVGQEVNISSNTEIVIRDIVYLISTIMDYKGTITEDTERLRPKNSEVSRLKGDNGKIHSLTGYTPEYDIQSGIKKTIEWFSDKNNLKMFNPNIYNV